MKLRPLLFSFLILSFLASLDAQILDPEFGNWGKYKVSVEGGYGSTFVIKPFENNKVLIGGKNTRESLNESGSGKDYYYWFSCTDLKGNPIDDFGQKGNVYIKGASKWLNVGIVDFVVDKHNRIIAVCQGEREILLYRFNRKGQLDLSFGNQGSVKLQNADSDRIEFKKIILKSDGKLLVLFAEKFKSTYLYQLLEDGDFDMSFGENGKRLFEIDYISRPRPPALDCQSMEIVAGNEILLLGTIRVYDSTSSSRLKFQRGFMMKLDEYGKVDSTYGENSYFFHHELDLLSLDQSLMLPDGKILIAGKKPVSFEEIVAKIDINGQVDHSFSDQGKLKFPTTWRTEELQPAKLLISPAQKIQILFQGGRDVYLCQYDLSGKLDSSFAQNGIYIFKWNNVPEICYQPEDKILYMQNNLKLLGRLTESGINDWGFASEGSRKLKTIEGTGIPHSLEIDSRNQLWLGANGVGGSTYTGMIKSFPSQESFREATYSFKANSWDIITDIKLTTDNRILYAGMYNYRLGRDDWGSFLSARMLDGTPDLNFTPPGNSHFQCEYCSPRKIHLLPNGNIIVAGEFNYPGFIRFKPNGESILTDWGGIVVRLYNSIPLQIERKLHASWVSEEGKMMMVSRTKSGEEMAIIQFDEGGLIDSSFAQHGVFLEEQDFRCVGIVESEENQLIFGGDENGSFQLRAYNKQGFPDLNFGENGIVSTSYPLHNLEAKEIKKYPDGKLLVGGFALDRATQQKKWALARYDADGKLDKKFGEDGIFIMAFDDEHATAHSFAIQGDGSLFIAGNIENDLIIAKLIPKLKLDPSSIEKQIVIYPNPIGHKATLRYDLSKDQFVRLSLSTINGQEVYSFFEDERTQGDHEEILTFPENLYPGWYILSLHKQNGISSLRVLIKR